MKRYARRRKVLLALVLSLPLLSFGCGLDIQSTPNALFVGNSILVGNRGSGMCASSPDRDYFAIVTRTLTERDPDFTAERVKGTSWEKATTVEQQDAFLATITPHLTADLDYVVLQLGDNVKNDALRVFRQGMTRFIERVTRLCPKAQIIWVGAWYSSGTKQRIMAEVCAEQGIAWVDIYPLNHVDNQARVGEQVVYLDGSTATVEDTAVASHPGDRGMNIIAEAICAALR